MQRWRGVALAVVVVCAALVRLWLIQHFPEPDADAKGHLGIARALLSDPTNISLHWVWLPAYHFLLAGLLLVGFSASAIRIFNCALAMLIPFVVLRYGESGQDPSDRSPHYAPWMAAVFCAVSPLVNLLGTSAQQETVFTLLMLVTVWSMDRRRFGLAGAVLALAALIRYEAWGAVVLMVILRAVECVPAIRKRLPESLRDACRIPLITTLPSVFAVGAWLLVHKLREGQWFGFLHELYRYTHVQRDSFHRAATADLLWFPVRQPLYVFGWIVAVLFFVGIRRAWRPGYVVPLGVYLFLVGSYVLKGTLGSARYYESLTPFVALAAAHGAHAIGSRRRWIVPALFAAASWQLTSLSVQLCRWTWPPDLVAESSLRDTPSLANPAAPGIRQPGRGPTAFRR